MKAAQNTLLEQHIFSFNVDRNFGERLTLDTKIFAAGGGRGIYSTQELILNSYNNSASFNVGSLLHPAKLRELADQLEEAIKKANHNANLEIGIDFDAEQKSIAKEQEQLKKLEKEIEGLNVAGHKFSPIPWYNPYGDTITCKTIDTAYFAARVNDFLDMYYTIESKKPIGFLLRDIQHLLKQTGLDEDDDFSRVGDISVDRLILAASSGVKDQKLASEYFKALKMAEPYSLPLKDLIPQISYQKR